MHKKINGGNRLIIFKDHNKRKNKEELLAGETRTRRRRSQRVIGVVYNPEYERYGNYVPTNLAKRYDAFLHIDKTCALHPLHMPEIKEDEDLPETFPSGL
jgi:hypothetical protein